MRRISMSDKHEQLLRDYAAGAISWSLLRRRGYESYLDVLAGLGRLGLRPPIAAMDGPNREARQRARALLQEALR
jgi:hypothetical protein